MQLVSISLIAIIQPCLKWLILKVTNPVHVAFLVQTEEFRTKAYCHPPDAYPNSGVTIGVGVDLGSKTEASLTKAGVSKWIVKKLTPYFGHKGEAACIKAKIYEVVSKGWPNLVLSKEEALDLSSKMISTYATETENWYNAAKTKTAKAFTELTCAQRTVIVDVLYQYGSPQVF